MQQKAPNLFGALKAGAVGIEPTSTVLETVVLPLNYAPRTIGFANSHYYTQPKRNCKLFFL